MLQGVCCMNLNTYGMVIGWLGAISSLIGTIILSVALGFTDHLIHRPIYDPYDPYDSYSSKETALAVLPVAALSVLLVFKVINLLSSVLLIVGTVKQRHLLLLPWMINSSVFLVIASFAHMAMCIGLMNTNGAFPQALLPIMLMGSFLALGWYLYYGIYSLFKQIQASSKIERPLNPPQTLKLDKTSPSYTQF
ncbi:hypothetical protein KR026_012024 [Drosophila bipectinata]|nr:hypothetical protein KR026_012024 [Drosophila bipectinata]